MEFKMEMGVDTCSTDIYFVNENADTDTETL